MEPSNDPRNDFNKIFRKFLEAPTTQNRDQLMVAAEKYRDAWILTMASGGHQTNVPDPSNWAPEAIAQFYSEQLSKTSSSTKYSRKLEAVRSLGNGLPIKLALQERTNLREKKTYWTVSWRTKYSPSGTNRRFYYSAGQYWHCPATVALELLEDLNQQGGLGEEYLDIRPGNANIKVIINPDTQETDPSFYHKQCRSIFAPDEYWGSSPKVVALSDTNSDWKKVMIVNNENLDCTFRSLTKNSTYMPKKGLEKSNEWWLDNAMMDANVQQMRIFHEELKKIVDVAQ